jgi:hypothetical protein
MESRRSRAIVNCEGCCELFKFVRRGNVVSSFSRASFCPMSFRFIKIARSFPSTELIIRVWVASSRIVGNLTILCSSLSLFSLRERERSNSVPSEASKTKKLNYSGTGCRQPCTKAVLCDDLFFLLGTGYLRVPTSRRFTPRAVHQPGPYQKHSCVCFGTESVVTNSNPPT